MTPPAASRGLLQRPLGLARAALIGAVVLAAMSWHFGDAFTNFRIHGDDWPYLAESRTVSALRSNLGTPHNAHVVPLFRLLTHVICRASGTLEGLPSALERSCVVVIALVMLGTGHLVAHETKSLPLGLAAMALTGLTSTLESCASWFSAAQTLWAALMVVGMLVALQAYRRRENRLWLIPAAAAAMAAPSLWSGGYAAGPVGAVYLALDFRPRVRRAALVPVLAGAVSIALLLILRGGFTVARGDAPESGIAWTMSGVNGLSYIVQVIPEILVLRNLGIDASTTWIQGAVLTAAIAVLWIRTRGPARPTPLEGAGAALALIPQAMALAFRGGYPFSSLRDLGWYYTMPHVGAVLFVCGWIATCRIPPRSRMDGTLGGGLLVLVLSAALLTLHYSRERRLLIESVPPMLPVEAKVFPIPSLQRLRAAYLASVDAERQRRFLARMDRLEAASRASGLTSTDLRTAFGPLRPPLWPAHVPGDAFELLDLPEAPPGLVHNSIPAEFAPLVVPEPMVRPTWLPANTPWPPDGSGL